MASLAQKTRAIHLYRHSLKNMLSWAIRREIFYEEARPALQRGGSGKEQRRALAARGGRSAQPLPWAPAARPVPLACSQCLPPLCAAAQAAKLRAEFEALKNLQEPAQIERALEKGEAALRGWLHPDPYIGARSSELLQLVAC